MPSYLSIWRGASAHATRKTDILAVVDCFQDRIPWQLGRRVLEQYGVPTAHGWENTIAEIGLHDDLPKVDLDGLYGAFVAHVCCGEKSVRLFDLGPTNAASLRKALAAKTNLKRLPQPPSRTELRKVNAGDPHLVHVFKEAKGDFAVYAAVIRKEERVRIAASAMPANAPLLAGYDEFIAVRAVKVGAYGVIWMPPTGNVVEVRVDYPVGDTLQELNSFHQKMYAALHSLCGTKTVVQPIYLHSAIKSLYDAAGDGVVTDLTFTTTTGSTKNEHMRSAQCLRQETFHVGGRKALPTEIEPYKIGLNWALDVPGTSEFTHPELHLDGNMNDGKALISATIRRATTFREYDWVRDKLIEHL